MRFKLEVAFPDDEDKSFLHINLLDEQDEIVYTIRTVYQSVKTVILKRNQLVRTIEWETNKIIKLGSHGQGVEATTTETELEFSHGRHIVENDEFKYWWSTAMRQHLPKLVRIGGVAIAQLEEKKSVFSRKLVLKYEPDTDEVIDDIVASLVLFERKRRVVDGANDKSSSWYT